MQSLPVAYGVRPAAYPTPGNVSSGLAVFARGCVLPGAETSGGHVGNLPSMVQ